MKKINVLLVLILLSLIPAEADEKTPYLIMVSLDGFRYDYLERDITPNLKKFESEGIRASSLKPVFPSSTFPNHLSIITGMYAENHGIISNNFKNYYTGETYSISKPHSMNNAKWYLGEPFWTSARRQGIKTASYFWPGSEVDAEYMKPDYYCRFSKDSAYLKRINGVIEWLKLPYAERPKFITLYLEETDSRGHAFGPESGEINSAIGMLDSLIGLLEHKVNDIGLKDSVNFIVLSDHGMASISKDSIIKIDEILRGRKCDKEVYGAYAMIYAENPDDIYDVLKLNEFHFKVYKKEDMPEYLHYSKNALIGDVIMIADKGWMINEDKDSGYSGNLEGAHGFDPVDIDMHGYFWQKARHSKPELMPEQF